jgi:hypothetical protein
MPQTGASARNEQRLPEPHSRPRYTASGADLGEVLLRRSRRSRHSNRPRFHLGGRPPQSGAGLVGAQGLLMTHQSDTQCLGGRTQWRVARGSPGRWRLLELPLELAAGPCDLYRLPVAIHRPPNTTVTVCPVPAATHTQLHLHDRHLKPALPSTDLVAVTVSSTVMDSTGSWISRGGARRPGFQQVVTQRFDRLRQPQTIHRSRVPHRHPQV